ncbi:MAG TPA: hypothetical protein DEG09_13030 [Marinilabiliaceae bacterium]|nr:hypothetical protein [Marinilabiliaceae bacterium]
MRKATFIILFLGTCLMLSAREYRFRIIDTAQGTALAYASFYLKNSNIGTVSNEEGYVVINGMSFESDTVIVSHLGYETKTIPFSSLLGEEEIKIESQAIALREVIVSPMSAKDLVKRATENLIINYPTKVTVHNFSVNHIIFTSDSIISQFQGTIYSPISDYIKQAELNYLLAETSSFEDNRHNFDFILPYYLDAFANNLIEKLYLGQLDFVKNRNKYHYSFLESNNPDLHIVSFYPLKSSRKHCFTGNLIINKRDKAFVSIDYSVTTHDLIKERVISIDKRFASGVIHLDSIKVNLNFIKISEVYVMSHFKNECCYLFSYDNSEKLKSFAAINEVVNHFKHPGDIINIKELESVSLYNLKGIGKSSDKSNPYTLNYFSRKIERKINELKEKYPDLE